MVLGIHVRSLVEGFAGRPPAASPPDVRREQHPAPQEENWQARIYEALQAFSPGAPVDEFRFLAGRAAEIQRMIETVVQRGQHAIVYGERGVGKSSLANTFASHLAKHPSASRCVHVNCHPSDDFATVWRRVFRRLDIGSKGGFLKYSERIDPDDVVLELAELRPIVILDEFDKLPPYYVRGLIANTIKNLSDRSVPSTVFVVGVAESANELIEEHPSILRCLRQIPMQRMGRSELSEILERSSLSLGMTISKGALTRIVAISCGLPHYTHLLGQKATNQALEAHTLAIDVQHVDAAIAACIAETAQVIHDQYGKSVRGVRQRGIFPEVLTAAALLGADDGRFTPAELRLVLAKLLRRKESHSLGFGGHLRKLCSDGGGFIFERTGSTRRYRYRFIEPMMQPFALMQGVRLGIINWDQIVNNKGLSVSDDPGCNHGMPV